MQLSIILGTILYDPSYLELYNLSYKLNYSLGQVYCSTFYIIAELNA